MVIAVTKISIVKIRVSRVRISKEVAVTGSVRGRASFDIKLVCIFSSVALLAIVLFIRVLLLVNISLIQSLSSSIIGLKRNIH